MSKVFDTDIKPKGYYTFREMSKKHSNDHEIRKSYDHNFLVEIVNNLSGYEEVNYINKAGYSILMRAIQLKLDDIVEILVNNPAIDINYIREYTASNGIDFNQSALSICAKSFWHNQGNKSNLFDKINKICLKILKTLLSHINIDINIRDSYMEKVGLMALNYKPAFDMFLNHVDFDIRSVDKDNNNILEYLINNKFGGFDKYILPDILNHPDIDPNNINGNTLLMEICNFLNTPRIYKYGLVQLITDCNICDVNAQNKDGKTALMLYVENDNYTNFISLIEHPGIDMNIVDNSGRDVLLLAVIANTPEKLSIRYIKKILEKDDILIYKKDKYGLTCLDYVTEDSKNIGLILLDYIINKNNNRLIHTQN